MSSRGILDPIFDPPTPPQSGTNSRSQSPLTCGTHKYKPLKQKVQERYESKDPFFSFEFFPPRTANGALNLLARYVFALHQTIIENYTISFAAGWWCSNSAILSPRDYRFFIIEAMNSADTTINIQYVYCLWLLIKFIHVQSNPGNFTVSKISVHFSCLYHLYTFSCSPSFGTRHWCNLC